MTKDRVRRQVRRSQVLLRRHGPTAPSWRKCAAIFGGAVVVGLVAIAFARLADQASAWFATAAGRTRWLPIFLTPATYALIAWATRTFAPSATGSRGLMMPLLATALIAEGTASLVARERLYHGLARGFAPDG